MVSPRYQCSFRVKWPRRFRLRAFIYVRSQYWKLEIATVLLIERRDRKQGAGRIFAIDTDIAQRCAALHVPSPRSDRYALIAAPCDLKCGSLSTYRCDRS